MSAKRRRNGFTLIEVLIVVVIMAVLAATIIPQFSDSSEDAKLSSLKFNLHTLRSQIELYKLQHNGQYPTTLNLLTQKTNADHTTTGTPALGPYIVGDLPTNPINNLNTVTAVTVDPIAAGSGSTGWQYNRTTGKIAADHATHFAL